jgi:predicted nucleotidyltransferase
MKLSTVEEREKLLKDELIRIVGVIQNEYDPERIILFGSMAVKKVHEWSDIDLLIIKKTSKRLIERALEVGRLIQPKVGIDLFIYTPEEYEILLKERSSFLLSVLKTGETVYEKRDRRMAEARE